MFKYICLFMIACGGSNDPTPIKDAGNDIADTSINYSSNYTAPTPTAPPEINPGYPPNGNSGSDFGAGTGCTLNSPCKSPSKM